MIRTKLGKLSFLGLGLALIVSGCSASGSQATKGRSAGAKTVPVEVKAVSETNFSQKFTLSGNLQSQQKWEVSPKISGKLTMLNVKAGDHVTAGQVIAKLDDQDLALQVQNAQTALQSAQAHYEDTTAPPKQETIQQDQNAIQDAQNKYQQAQRAVDYDQQQLNRNQSLFNAGALAQKDLNDSQKTLDDAKSALASALTTVNNAQAKLQLDQEGATQGTVKVAQASIDQAQVNLKQAQDNLANATLTSPISGIVSSVPVNLGTTVSSGTVVAEIVDLSSMKVKTQASDSQVAALTQGQEVNVKVTGVNKDLTGKIESVSPSADSTKTFPVDITIPNPNGDAKEGMIATVVIPSNPHNALVVPMAAVVQQQDKTFVYVVDQGKAKQVNVKIGDSDGTNTEILSGVTKGQEVVVNGQNNLYPDCPVTVMDPANSNSGSNSGSGAKHGSKSGSNSGTNSSSDSNSGTGSKTDQTANKQVQ